LDRFIRPAKGYSITMPRERGRACAPNIGGVPVLGATPVENLFIGTGHGHLGPTLAAGSGRLVADAIIERAPAICAADYELPGFS